MRLRILLSYWYFRKFNLEEYITKRFNQPFPEVFIDSGAFSAYTKGVTIDVFDYARFLSSNAKFISVYSNLDVIGDFEETDKNQKILEDMGLSPLPVYHASKTFKNLENYLERYKYIALGGLVPYSSQHDVRMRFLIQAFKMAREMGAGYHGFGISTLRLIAPFNWKSVDSTGWLAGCRYGNTQMFDKKTGRMHIAKIGDVISCKKCAHLFEELGFDWKDFAYRKRDTSDDSAYISARAYIDMEIFIRQKQEKRMEKFRTKIYLANSNARLSYEVNNQTRDYRMGIND